MKKLKQYLPESLKKRIKSILFGKINGGLKTFFQYLPDFESYIKDNQTVIEVGSERGFGSSYLLAKFCENHNLNFITIDPNEETYRKVRETLLEFENEKFNAINEKGEVYLAEYKKQDIFFAYLDGFDVVFPGKSQRSSTLEAYKEIGIDLLSDGNEISAKVHFDTALYVEENLVKGGVIGFDDSWYANSEWHGKGKTAIPYLLDKGYKLINSNIKKRRNQSIILQKPYVGN